MQKTLRTITFLCLTLLIAPILVAQDMVMENREDATAPTFFGESGLFQTTSGSTLQQGEWSFGAYLNQFRYTMADGRDLRIERFPSTRRAYQDMSVIEDRFSASLGYGITDRWEINMQFPLVTVSSDEGDGAGYMLGYPYAGKFNDNGAGNLHLGMKFGLLSPSNSHSLAVTGFIDFNTGHEDSGIATGNSDYGVGLAWNRGVYYVSSYYLNRGRRDSSNAPDGMRFQVANEARVDFGINIPLDRFGATNWITEVNTVWYVSGDRQPDDIISVSTGVRHWMDNTPWGFSAAIRNNATAGFGGSYTSGWGFLAGVHYKPVSATVVAPPPPPVSVPMPPPVPAPVAQPEPVAEPRQPQELRADNVMFDKDSARVTNIGKALLDDVALRMRQEPAATAIVKGYAGSDEAMGDDNDLDRRRAEAVRDYLVSRHNLDSSRISVEAMGATDLMENNMIAVVRLIVP